MEQCAPESLYQYGNSYRNFTDIFPVGMNLYIITNVNKGKIGDVMLGALPVILPMIVIQVIITLFPLIVTSMPDLFMP